MISSTMQHFPCFKKEERKKKISQQSGWVEKHINPLFLSWIALKYSRHAIVDPQSMATPQKRDYLSPPLQKWVHLRRCRTSHQALCPWNKWLVARLPPPPLLISNTLKHVPCVRSLRLIDGADSWSEAGRPPVSGRLPSGRGPVVWRQWIFIGFYDYATSWTASPRRSQSSSSRLPPAARSDVIDFQLRNNPPSFPGENTDALHLFDE